MWIICGLAATLVARVMPAGRTSRWLVEALIAVMAAVVLGFVASALDFGGWKEIDARAAALAAAGAFAMIGLTRSLALWSRRRAPQS